MRRSVLLAPVLALALHSGTSAAVATPLRYTSAADGRPASADLRVDGWLTFRIRCERPGRLQLAYFSQELDLLPAAARSQPLRLILEGGETAVPAAADPVGLVGAVDLTPALAAQIASSKTLALWGPADQTPLQGGDAGPLRRVAKDCAG
jgi:hypothetical protein